MYRTEAIWREGIDPVVSCLVLWLMERNKRLGEVCIRELERQAARPPEEVRGEQDDGRAQGGRREAA